MSSELMSILMGLFGGLGLFLYGMNVMSDGLEKAAGDRLKRIIEVLTRNKYLGVIVGAFVTVIVQSSSATTVMVVGFVNAGIMNLTQAVGIIMGANIGTTVTAQLVSIKLTAIAPIAIGLGVIMKFFISDPKIRKYADILLGFGILFLGMDLMKDAVKPLRSYEGFTNLLLSFTSGRLMDTILAIFTGFAITAIIQSSSATTGILVAFASQGMLPIEAAFPILLGTNIGTCVTAMLSSISANKTAKRAALMHLLFNLIGTVVFIIAFWGITVDTVQMMSSVPERQLANAHTFFNIINTVLLLPFSGLLVKAVERMIPVEESELEENYGVKYIDERIMETPSIAIGQVMKEVLHMGNVASKSYNHAVAAFRDRDSNKANETFKLEKNVNELEHKISDYLVKITNSNISQEQRIVIDGLFNTINDIERVGDHADNLAELAVYAVENNVRFSDKAMDEINEMTEITFDTFRKSLSALKDYDKDLAKEVLEAEGQVDQLEKELRKKHIRRLNEGRCETSAGILFLDMISNLERVSDHASNIALAVLDVQ